MKSFFDGRYSHETIRQGILKIQSSFGKRIFTPDKKEWTARQIASKLRRAHTLVASVCSSGDITGCRKQGGDANARWLIDETGLKELRRHPLICKKNQCVICSRKFKVKTTRPKTCSPKCARVHAAQLRSRLVENKLDTNALSGKALRVWQAIQRCAEPKKWVTIGEAATKTNLTEMQVRWYVMRGIITSKPHPTRNSGRGERVTLCAFNQVKVMARVIAS